MSSISIRNFSPRTALLFDITFFGKQAESFTKWFKKGRPVLIEGKLNYGSWEDKATYVAADVIDESSRSRHDPVKLALAISEAYRKHRGKRRRLPRLRRNLYLTPLTVNRPDAARGTEN